MSDLRPKDALRLYCDTLQCGLHFELNTHGLLSAEISIMWSLEANEKSYGRKNGLLNVFVWKPDCVFGHMCSDRRLPVLSLASGSMSMWVCV